MKSDQPKISVITVCYNSAETLGAALESLRNQTNKDFESIVVDGGSKDSTPSIVKAYSDVVDQFVSEPDKGIYDAMNRGVALAQGEYIAFLNSDDRYFPNTIAQVVASISSGDADVYYGDLMKERVFGKEVFTRLEKPDLSRMEKTMSIFHPASFAKKALFEKHGGFDLRFKLASDYHWFLKVYLADARFEYIAEPLAVFHVGGASNLSCESYREASEFQAELGLKSSAQMSELYDQCLKKQGRQRLIARFANLPILRQIYLNRLKKRWR